MPDQDEACRYCGQPESGHPGGVYCPLTPEDAFQVFLAGKGWPEPVQADARRIRLLRSTSGKEPWTDAKWDDWAGNRPRNATHIIAMPGDRRTLCGIKDAVPHVWAKFVQAHVDGWAMPVCPDCAAVNAGAGAPSHP